MAREYAPLAVNLYSGCTHACTYCYAPNALRRDRAEYHQAAKPRAGILDALRIDAAKLAAKKCRDEILLCFTCDPYAAETDTMTTRSALRILGEAGLNATVLTKGGMRAERDFDLLKKFDFAFASTLCWTDDIRRAQWEPNAATVAERMEAIRRAHTLGIRTWVSIEPVIVAAQALAVIESLAGHVDLWKVGKINYNAAAERANDWPVFTRDVVALCARLKQNLFLKESLARFAP